VTARGRSTPRCRRKPVPLAASALVVNAIVFDRRTLRLAVPDGNRACGLRLEHDLSDRFADQLRDTAPRPGRGHAQRVEFFLSEVNLGVYHMCVTLRDSSECGTSRKFWNYRAEYDFPHRFQVLSRFVLELGDAISGISRVPSQAARSIG